MPVAQRALACTTLAIAANVTCLRRGYLAREQPFGKLVKWQKTLLWSGENLLEIS